MNKMLPIALAALFVAAGCAGTGTAGNGATRTAAAGKTQYCWKERLSTEGDNLVCNWATSAADACESREFGNVLKKSAVAAGPENGRLCSNGQWLVQVTTR